MRVVQPSTTPSESEIVETLRDGFWDHTQVIRLPDGTLRVRKASKGAQAPGPWAARTLRREIQYLTALGPAAAQYFPRLLAAWDNGLQLGYEMSYIEGAVDAGTLAQSAAMTQAQADTFQDKLSDGVFGSLHAPAAPQESLAAHVHTVIADALTKLEQHSEFATLINSHTIRLNGMRMAGPRAGFQRLEQHGAPLDSLDRPPCVRLHGDLFLENILLPRHRDEPGWPSRLILIDPVSVAGVFQGHPLFDLVKYESYATGELLALRSEKVAVSGLEGPCGRSYAFRVLWGDPVIQPFCRINWYARFRAAHQRTYGAIDWAAYRLLEGYFSLAMALCTFGLQRRGRVLKATWALNAAADPSHFTTDT